MAKIELLAPKILKWEGGFVDHPLDRGGPTNKGITIGTYESYCRKKGYPRPTIERLKNLSDDEWMEILRTLYWNRWKADEINNQSIANLVVDWVWASGVYGIKYPQEILGVSVDGFVGVKTLSVINNYESQKELFKKLWNRRKKHFEDIVKRNPSQKVFLRGWLNRLNDFKYE